MSLIINNPDWQMVEEGADETLNFWDHASIEILDIGEFDDGADEVSALINDYHLVNKQCQALIALMPEKESSLKNDLKIAVNEIEKKIKKVCGIRVDFVDEIRD
jgi:hypothetical protein